jgi:hypothetical protein
LPELTGAVSCGFKAAILQVLLVNQSITNGYNFDVGVSELTGCIFIE